MVSQLEEQFTAAFGASVAGCDRVAVVLKRGDNVVGDAAERGGIGVVLIFRDDFEGDGVWKIGCLLLHGCAVSLSTPLDCREGTEMIIAEWSWMCQNGASRKDPDTG